MKLPQYRLLKISSDRKGTSIKAEWVDFVTCGECKRGEYREEFDDYECHASGCGLVYDADFYCADGERKDDE